MDSGFVCPVCHVGVIRVWVRHEPTGTRAEMYLQTCDCDLTAEDERSFLSAAIREHPRPNTPVAID